MALMTLLTIGMLLLAAWSTNGWLPSGHAMRMALDLGLHRALEKLAEDNGKKRSEEEERNLGQPVSLLYLELEYSHLDKSSRPASGAVSIGSTISEYVRP